MGNKKFEETDQKENTKEVIIYSVTEQLLEKYIQLLHMSRKAGKLVIGIDNVERAILQHRCRLIIVAEDLARNSYEKVERLPTMKSVQIIRVGTKKQYGQAFDAMEIGILCITDKNFAAGIFKLLANK
jgi:ribosomal protein L7Ae-like RNA K-turn-binding protein